MLATEDDIRQIYRLILGREADAETLEHWLPKIRKNGITAPEFAALALATEEYRFRSPASGLG